MKKVSTVAVQQSRNFPKQNLTIGFDLGDRSSWYCMLDEAGDERTGRNEPSLPPLANWRSCCIGCG